VQNKEKRLFVIDFKGSSYQVVQSEISGAPYVKWTGEPKLYPQLPVYSDKVVDKDVVVPQAYWLPPQHQLVLQRLKLHGIEVMVLDKPQKVTLQQLSVTEHSFAQKPFEGRFMLDKAQFSRSMVSRTLPAGWVRVSTDQALGRLAVALLEPTAPDSFFSWGFFTSMFELTEYFEPYALEPLIAGLLQEQPQLQQQFDQALQANEALRNDPRARYDWFYQKLRYYDQAYLKYPVLIEP